MEKKNMKSCLAHGDTQKKFKFISVLFLTKLSELTTRDIIFTSGAPVKHQYRDLIFAECKAAVIDRTTLLLTEHRFAEAIGKCLAKKHEG